MAEHDDTQSDHLGAAFLPPLLPTTGRTGSPAASEWPLAGLATSTDPAPDPELEEALLRAARQRGPAADHAVAQLWSRHLPAVRRLARSVAPGADPHDADDLVSESFARVLGVLRSGGGPTAALRPYWLRTLRRVAVDTARRGTRTVLGGQEATPEPAPHPSAEQVVAAREEAAAARRAWASLTEESRVLLWHLVVEGRTPAQVAPLLGVSANAVSSRGSRARERLREAFLTHRLGEPRTEACRAVRPLLGGFVRDGLSVRDRVRVEVHLRDCATCRTAVAEAAATSRLLRRSVLPLVLLPGVVPVVTGASGSGVTGVLAGLLAGSTPTASAGAATASAGVATASAGVATGTAAGVPTGAAVGAPAAVAAGLGPSGVLGLSVAAAAAVVVTVAAVGTAPTPPPAAQDRPRPAATSLRQPADPGSPADRADVPVAPVPWSAALLPDAPTRAVSSAPGGSGPGQVPLVGTGAGTTSVLAVDGASGSVDSVGPVLAGGAGGAVLPEATGADVPSAGAGGVAGVVGVAPPAAPATDGAQREVAGSGDGPVLASGHGRIPAPSSGPTGTSSGPTLDLTLGPSGTRVARGAGHSGAARGPGGQGAGPGGHGGQGGQGAGQGGGQGSGQGAQGDQGHGGRSSAGRGSGDQPHVGRGGQGGRVAPDASPGVPSLPGRAPGPRR